MTTQKSEERKGVLVVNTGSPEALSEKHVGQFIGDMLSDKLVMNLPDWFRLLLARNIIAPLRRARSFEKYKQIWGNNQVSPLTQATNHIGECLEKLSTLPVVVGMRYGNPAISNAIDSLLSRTPDLNELILLPLFPQYAESSYLTAVEAVCEYLSQNYPCLSLNVIPPYYKHRTYIDYIAKRVEASLDSSVEHLVFSFHSLPPNHILRGKSQGEAYDYEQQCYITARLVAQQLGFSPETYSVAFASAIKRNWLKPFLSAHLEELLVCGKKSVGVVAPGFIVDNLETLYDIDIEMRALFLSKGGERFVYIPCLNESFSEVGFRLVSEVE